MFPVRALRWLQTPVTASSLLALVAPSSAVALRICECADDLATSGDLILPAESGEVHLAENDLPLSYRCSVESALAPVVDSSAQQFLSSRSLPMQPCAGGLSDQSTRRTELERYVRRG